jgi:hypothetical protein
MDGYPDKLYTRIILRFADPELWEKNSELQQP